MKRKLGIVLSLILVLSVAFCGTAFAEPNPNDDEFNFMLHTVYMRAYCGSSYGSAYSTYQNSETFTMSVTCYYYYWNTSDEYCMNYSSDGGLNKSVISFAVDGENVETPDFARNRTRIGCGGSVFLQTITAG